MYLKWLIDSDGNRVSEAEAVESFGSLGLLPAQILQKRGWKFLAVAGLPELDAAIELLLAKVEWDRVRNNE